MIRSMMLVSALLCSAAVAAPPLAATTQPLTRLTAENERFGVLASPDQQHVMTLAQSGKQVTAQLNGQPVGTYDWVVPNSLSVCTDGSVFGFIAQSSAEMFLVRGGKPLKPVYEILPPYRMSDDGAHVLFNAIEKVGGQHAVYDETPGPTCDKILFLAMNGAGNRWLSAGKRGDRMILADGAKELSPPEAIDMPSPPSISKDGKHIAWSYTTGDKKDFAVVDDHVMGPFDRVLPGSPLLSPDGLHWLLCVKKNGQTEMMSDDGKTIDKADEVGFSIFSADGKRLAYFVRHGDKDSAVLDGKTLGTFPKNDLQLSSVRFSTDGSHLAYIARHAEDKVFVAVDGQEQPAQFAVQPPVFSEDGKHIAYFFNFDKSTMGVMVDGKPLDTKFEGFAPNSLTFSPDGSHVAYLVGSPTKGGRLYVDNDAGPEFTAALPTTRVLFDGKIIRFTAVAADKTIVLYTVTPQ